MHLGLFVCLSVCPDASLKKTNAPVDFILLHKKYYTPYSRCQSCVIQKVTEQWCYVTGTWSNNDVTSRFTYCRANLPSQARFLFIVAVTWIGCVPMARSISKMIRIWTQEFIYGFLTICPQICHQSMQRRQTCWKHALCVISSEGLSSMIALLLLWLSKLSIILCIYIYYSCHELPHSRPYPTELHQAVQSVSVTLQTWSEDQAAGDCLQPSNHQTCDGVLCHPASTRPAEPRPRRLVSNLACHTIALSISAVGQRLWSVGSPNEC